MFAHPLSAPTRRRQFILLLLAATASLSLAAAAQAQQRALGLDLAAWQGDIAQQTWDNFLNVENRQFVFIRASRGGTTGIDQRQDGLHPNPDAFTLSQRYDDAYFIQNITRATKAGMFAGSYHFGRMDVVVGTADSDGTPNTVANNGTDEANHFLEMAGPWMRPGYLLPVFDLEAGISQRTGAELAQFAIDFSNRIFEVKGIRPAVYIGGNYANEIQNESDNELEAAVAAAYPTLWSARWPNQSNPNAIAVQTAHPKDSYTPIYGVWDNYGTEHPWSFWQYASTGRLQSFNNGNSNLDFDVARGGVEFLKDKLVPALWTTDASGDWSTLSNWNSGVAESEPVRGPGQVPAIGVDWTGGALPARPEPRLPGVDDAIRNVDGQNDTVVLDRGAANPTITLSSGTHNIRKLYARETLNLTGGSLTLNYVPSADSTTYAGRFSAPVTLGPAASLSLHTLQVDPGGSLTLQGGALTFNQIDLMPDVATPGKLVLTGPLNLTPQPAATLTIANGAGAGLPGQIDLGGANRVFNVGDDTAAIDATIIASIARGGITKAGAGTLKLAGALAYKGDTVVQEGSLLVESRVLPDRGRIFLTTGGLLDLKYTGAPNFIDSLFLDGEAAAQGVWGAPGSGAQFTSPLITGTGTLKIAPAGPGDLIDDFEANEGHFGWPYNQSPGQTTGLSASTTINRVTTQAQRGNGSQELNLVIDAVGDESWQLKHNSGVGIASSPIGNKPLEPTGVVGLWLKTDDPGVSVQIAVDDPMATSGNGSTALELGVWREVISDDKWHLYQWNFGDASQWEPLAGSIGANGEINGALGKVSIDSIFFQGSGNAQIYLDAVSHNPDAPLSALLLEGDLDGDGRVSGDDLLTWKANFGATAAGRDEGDGDHDRDVDGADFLHWQRHVSPNATATPVPEPGSALLAALAVLGGAAVRRRRLPSGSAVGVGCR
jgi:MYXO-CTERM domain-containing protein